MASSIVASCPAGHNYLTPSAAAELIGCSVQTIANYCDAGILDCIRTKVGKHRRILRESLLNYLGFDSTDDEDNSGVAAYFRCSSQKQNESLKDQKEWGLREIENREGIDRGDVRVYAEISSAFGVRNQFNRLLSDIAEGKIKKLFVVRWNRLSRIAGMNRLLEYWFSTYDVEVVVLDDNEENVSDTEEWVKEIADYLTFVTSKQAGLAASRKTKRNLSDETIKRILYLWNEKGYNVNQIYATLREEGHQTETLQGRKSHVSYNKIRVCVMSGGLVDNTSGDRIRAVKKEFKAPEKTWTRWAKGHLRIREWDGDKSKRDRIRFVDMYEAYRVWCVNSGLEPTPRLGLQGEISNLKDRRQNSMNQVWYHGVDLI